MFNQGLLILSPWMWADSEERSPQKVHHMLGMSLEHWLCFPGLPSRYVLRECLLLLETVIMGRGEGKEGLWRRLL